MWPRDEWPEGSAYVLLDELGLSTEFAVGDNVVAKLEFVDGLHPGNDYLGVVFTSPLALSWLSGCWMSGGVGFILDWAPREH